MLMTLYPGADRDDALRTLREIESVAHNANQHSGFHGSKAYSRLTSYLEWATTSVRMLEHRVNAADIGRLVCAPAGTSGSWRRRKPYCSGHRHATRAQRTCRPRDKPAGRSPPGGHQGSG